MRILFSNDAAASGCCAGEAAGEAAGVVEGVASVPDR